MKVLVVIPTYNESKTIKKIVEKIFIINREYSILVVDDSSPDGTKEIVEQLKLDYGNLFILNRSKKEGLGVVLLRFKWAIDKGYDKVIQIDADLSHDPNDIPKLLNESSEYDLVIGSRYKSGINVVNWPLSRLFLSYFANFYSRLITGLPIKDSTGGFKCYDVKVLKSINLDKIRLQVIFQIEMNFITWLKI